MINKLLLITGILARTINWSPYCTSCWPWPGVTQRLMEVSFGMRWADAQNLSRLVDIWLHALWNENQWREATSKVTLYAIRFKTWSKWSWCIYICIHHNVPCPVSRNYIITECRMSSQAPCLAPPRDGCEIMCHYVSTLDIVSNESSIKCSYECSAACQHKHLNFSQARSTMQLRYKWQFNMILDVSGQAWYGHIDIRATHTTGSMPS